MTEPVDGGMGGKGVGTTVMPECASTNAKSTDIMTVRPADIIIAVDSSRSMDAEIGFVQDNLNRFSEQIVAAGVDARVILIGAQSAICIGTPLGTGQCPADSNPPNYIHINQRVGSNDALNIIIESFSQWREHLRPDATRSFFVVTDDDATDGPNNSAAAFSQAIAALDPVLFAEWTMNGVYCFTECQDAGGKALAAAVGEVYIDLIAETQGVSGDLCLQDFQPVFDRLAMQIVENSGSKISCEWDFPMPPPGQTFSPELVEVRRTTMSGTTPLTRVLSMAECATSPSGWYYDNPMSPTKILACPDTCTTLQSEAGGIDVIFGCELVEGCAASGSASVGTTPGGAIACEWPLPMPPVGQALDTASVNVRFRSATGVAITLGKVPAATDCAAAMGGWYYSDPSNPATMQLCPETCTQVQAAAAGASIDVLFGCKSIERPIPR